MQKLCCVRTIQQSSASLDHLSQACQIVSPSILIHFWWELYHNPTTIIEFIEEFEQILFSYEGKAGALSYIVRSTAIPDPLEDPMFGEPNSIYTSPRHETAARVLVDPTVNTHFNTNNGHVFDLLNDAVKDLLKIPVLYSSRSPALRGSSTLLASPVIFS